MYARHFGLSCEPFSIAPDPRCLFMSERHREALAHLLYGQQGSGGFVLLTGEIGTGKTTICRAFLEQVSPSCRVAYVLNPRLTVGELLQTVCEEFGIHVDASGTKAKVDALNRFLLATHAAGGSSVLVIDEAQNLSSAVLEQLRLLTNLETNERKLLQIMLIGQPELRDKLARPELEQLAQRVVARFHLGALDARDITPYMRHRLAVAGLRGAMPFDAAALRRIYRLSKGVPRRINLLADRALLGAYAQGLPRVNAAVVNQAAREAFAGAAHGPGEGWRRHGAWMLTAIASVVALLLITLPMWPLGAARKVAAQEPAASVALSPLTSTAAAAPSAAQSSMASMASAPTPALATAATTAATTTPSAPAALPMATASSALTLAREPDALRSLALLWGATLPPGEPCEQARAMQLQCFRSTSMTLATLRQLGRPGVVTLTGVAESTGSAVLVGLNRQGATLRSGSGASAQTHLLGLAEFGRAWRGDFTSYWRAHGSNGASADAAWLEQQLQRIDPATSALPLQQRIQSFQRAQGLPADGVAGAMTLMQLNRALGVAEPSLIEERSP